MPTRGGGLSPKRLGGLLVALAALGPGLPAPAQTPPAPLSREESTAYKAWYDVNATHDLPRAIGLARAYLEKYPAGRYAAYLKGWLPQVRAQLFSEAVKSANVDQMVRLGQEGLAEDPADLFYLYWLAVAIRSAEAWAVPVRSAHAAEVAGFTRRAIVLVEAGRVPAGIEPGHWSGPATLGYLYQTLAMLEETDGRGDRAAEYTAKAAAADPGNPVYAFDCGRLHQTSYLAAVREFQAVPEADRAVTPLAPDAQAVLDRVDREADQVIDCWARFMALTGADGQYTTARASVEQALVELYRYRHPDEPDGLPSLIERKKSAGGPGAASASPVKTTP